MARRTPPQTDPTSRRHILAFLFGSLAFVATGVVFAALEKDPTPPPGPAQASPPASPAR